MRIDPTDIAKLCDDDVRRLAIIGADVAAIGGPLSTFWTEFSNAAIRAVRERRSALAHLEQSFLDDDDAIGAIVPDIATGLARTLDTLDGGVR